KPGLSPSALVAGLVTRVPASPGQALYEPRLLGLSAPLNLVPVWLRRRLWFVVGRQTGVEVRNGLVLDRVLAGRQVDDVLQFLGCVQAHRNLGSVGADEEGGGPVHEHLFGHRLPLGAVFLIPALFLSQTDGYGGPDQLLARRLLNGPRTATPVVRSGLAHPLVADGTELAARVESGDEELAAPRRPPLDDVQVLHDHQRVGLHPQSHVEGNEAVGEVALVLFGNKTGRRQQPSASLHQLETVLVEKRRCRVHGLRRLHQRRRLLVPVLLAMVVLLDGAHVVALLGHAISASNPFSIWPKAHPGRVTSTASSE